MTLITIYESYSHLNNELTGWLDKQVAKDFEGNKEEILYYLQNTKEMLEKLLEQAEALEVEALHEKDLKDLQYLLADTMFLMEDLKAFYHYKEIGRLKMRAINYMNKRRRAELFGQ